MNTSFELRAAPGAQHTRMQPTLDTIDILAGLGRPQKTLPARLFYDEAGCALFGQITELPEYYVTRAERALLMAHGADIVSRAADGSALVEYGASEESKAALLLRARAARFSCYVPVDIAGPALAQLRQRMRTSHPGLDVWPIEADFTAPVTLPDLQGRQRLGFFPGSTIGNFDPPAAIRFLRQARHDLGRLDPMSRNAGPTHFIIGTDLRKSRDIVVPAYDDRDGVTAAFNRNILVHVNRITGATFDPDLFAHRAVWNDGEGRIEMHLVSRLPQVITVAGRQFSFASGETIHTENSYKHTEAGFLELAAAAGWSPDGFWTDPDGLFGMHRLVARSARAADCSP